MTQDAPNRNALATVTAYLASSFSRQAELRDYAERLAEIGVCVQARWLGEGHDLPVDADPETKAAMAVEFALDDTEDLLDADLFILFNGVPANGRQRGGLHVEFGMAVAWNKPVFLVGERINVFNWLPGVRHFDDFGALYLDLAAGPERAIRRGAVQVRRPYFREVPRGE